MRRPGEKACNITCCRPLGGVSDAGIHCEPQASGEVRGGSHSRQVLQALSSMGHLCVRGGCMADARVIMVVGMHRAGTSALTRGLTALGVDLGEHLLLPGADNPTGYWED